MNRWTEVAHHRLRRASIPLAVIAAALVGCSGLGLDPDEVGAIDFTGIPFPAVVTGDTLRDSSGAAAPLRATVYGGRGAVLRDAPVTFVTLDSGVIIDDGDYLRATRRDGTVRIVATAGALQSQARVIWVVRRPDTVVAPNTAVALQYRLPDATSNVSPALQLTLRSTDTTGGVSPNVPGWLVRWRIVHAGDTLSPTDTSTVALWPATATRHSLRDTTSTDGSATRRLRVYANTIPVRVDSFIVVAEVRHRGHHVAGSPVRFVVTLSPPTL